MNEFIEKYTSNAFGSLLAYIISAYFFENIWIIILISGLFFKFEILYNNLIQTLIGENTSRKSVFSIILLIFFIFTVFITIPIYKKGETLRITATVLKLKVEPGVGGTTIKRLKNGKNVMYLDKLWKRTRFYENGFHWDFWIKVKTENNEIGWVYGAYVKN